MNVSSYTLLWGDYQKHINTMSLTPCRKVTNWQRKKPGRQVQIWHENKIWQETINPAGKKIQEESKSPV
jgi:hypothetical protein